MTILFVEDRGSVALAWRQTFEEWGHKVLYAQSILDAGSHWQQSRRKIDCIVLDLNMNPEGLDGTHGGLLTGWVWLNDDVLNTRDGSGMRSRTVILTEYAEELHSIVDPGELVGVRVVRKGDGSDAWMQEFLREIEAQLGKKKGVSQCGGTADC